MISGQNIFENGFFYWGSGTAGQSFVLQATGVTVNGVTLWRLVPGSVTLGGIWEPLVTGGADSPEIVFSNGAALMTFVAD